MGQYEGPGNYIFNFPYAGGGYWGQEKETNLLLEEIWPDCILASGKRFVVINFSYDEYCCVGYFQDAPHIQRVMISPHFLTKCDDNTISLEDLNKDL